MQPHQQRVVQEKAELDEKIEKLEAFIQSEKFKVVDSEDSFLLNQQLAYMLAYSNTLQMRIERF